MFKPKTLFVIGAGASNEVNLPLGGKLVEMIRDDLNFFVEAGELRTGDGDLYQIVRNSFGGQDKQTAFRTARGISSGLGYANSIDRWIDTHSENEWIVRVGKLAIAYEILKAERESALFPTDPINNEFDHTRISNTWYANFARILFEDVRVSQIDQMFDGIAVICFNYDRCIQNFLPFAIQHHFRVDQAKAEAAANRLKIYHPYGTLGSLPSTIHSGQLAFGENPMHSDISGIASRIRTFSEQVDDQNAIEEIRREVATAKTIVFLGFGFHKDNLRLLTPEDGNRNNPRVFATTYDQPEANRKEIAHDVYTLLRSRAVLKKKIEEQVRTANLMAKDLLHDYWRSLQA